MRSFARSVPAQRALQAAENLQLHFVHALNRHLAEGVTSGSRVALDSFSSTEDVGDWQSSEWLRDEGVHGGGVRYMRVDDLWFNRASINVSQVHYDDALDIALGSATALSAIVHPSSPWMPSIHLHISFTERKQAKGYWRVMADLNPSHPNDAETLAFQTTLQPVLGPHFEHARKQGDLYFWIPALQRQRGSAHFYLENFTDQSPESDAQLAADFARAAIDWYARHLGDISRAQRPIGEFEKATQLAYHTTYFFQVLTLDRGTTSGLLVHDQNDVGILGSLPARIDRDLLAEWIPRVQAPQNKLMEALLRALPAQNPCPIDDETRGILAKIVRTHYRVHQEALELQASGFSVPPTVQNHGSS